MKKPGQMANKNQKKKQKKMPTHHKYARIEDKQKTQKL